MHRLLWFLPAPGPPFLWCWTCHCLWGVLLLVNAHVWVMVAWGVLFFFPPVSCLFLLCPLVEDIGSCILNHFCCPWGLCLLVSSGFVLWWCFPWNVPVFHTYCMCVWYFLPYGFLGWPVVSCDDGLVVVVCDAIVVPTWTVVVGAVVITCILLVAVNNYFVPF